MKASVIFTAILFGVAVMFVILSFQYRYEARIAPLLVGTLASVCLAVVLINGIRAMYRDKRSGAKGDQAAASGETATSVDFQLGVKGSLQAVAWVVGLVVCIYLVGLVIALPLFVLVYMRAYKERWLTSLVSSAGILLIVWGFFDKILHVSLYWGILLE